MFCCFWSGSSQSQTAKQEQKLSKTEGTTPASLNIPHGQTDLSVKPDNVKIKGLQANVSIPKVKALIPNDWRPAVFSDQGKLKKQAQNPDSCCEMLNIHTMITQSAHRAHDELSPLYINFTFRYMCI